MHKKHDIHKDIEKPFIILLLLYNKTIIFFHLSFSRSHPHKYTPKYYKNKSFCEYNTSASILSQEKSVVLKINKMLK